MPCARCRARSSPSRWCWWRCSCRPPSSPASPASSTASSRLTIAISTVISAVNSLTLSPALAAQLLKGHRRAEGQCLTRAMDKYLGWFFRGFNAAFRRVGGGWQWRASRSAISRKAVVVGLYLALVGVTWELVQVGARRLRPGPGQAVPGRLCAVARRCHRLIAPRK